MSKRDRKAVVCKQGHVGACCVELNETYTGDLKCGKCGNDFLINCLSCGCHIKGDPYYDDDLFSLPFIPPNNCHNCGKSYPWKSRLKFLKTIRFLNIKNKLGRVGTIITIIVTIVAPTLGILQFIFNLFPI